MEKMETTELNEWLKEIDLKRAEIRKLQSEVKKYQKRINFLENMAGELTDSFLRQECFAKISKCDERLMELSQDPKKLDNVRDQILTDLKKP